MVEKNNNTGIITDKVLFAIVALLGVIGVLCTLSIFLVVLPAQNVSSQFFNGLISALILQVLLVNTIFIWKIMHKADTVFNELRKRR